MSGVKLSKGDKKFRDSARTLNQLGRVSDDGGSGKVESDESGDCTVKMYAVIKAMTKRFYTSDLIH